MRRYNPKEIEPKWQKKWEETGIYKADESQDKPKHYVLEYFPYPSGAAMHVGHVRNYTIGDAIARFSRMQGKNVLYPMGWDAFGLPAENYAIKNKVTPRVAIEENTKRFKEQLMQMGFSYDWSREIDSSEPKYYKWTQWFFLLLYKRGLAYQKESLQWWCPVDKTVLANEQVEAGLCWRCSSQVVKKPLKQWFFKITDYADRLADDLDDIDWSESIKSMQRNWIGKSIGAQIKFNITDSDHGIEVFTTRPDTVFGATFIVLAPEHDLISKITTKEQKESVSEYLESVQAKSEIERQENKQKTGVFTGSYAINPANNEKIPIWIADYVLMGYGTGAIMAVPAHDERDNEFASKFDLPVRQVIAELYSDTTSPLQADKPTVARKVVCMVVEHPSEKKYLICKPKGGINWSPVMGGIDKDETPTQATVRELKEETGYTDIAECIEKQHEFASEFFAAHKNENRVAYVKTVFVKLKSLECETEQAVDADDQEVKWVTEKEYRSNKSTGGMREVLDIGMGKEMLMATEGLMINSGKYDGIKSSEAREKIVRDLADQKLGVEKAQYKIRDWLISRQRYWGAPIPIIHCGKCGAVPVSEDQLPVTLPEVDSYEPSGDGRSPLATIPEFVNTTCPKCHGPAERETDTMDGFACSSWYFLRFADPNNDEVPFSREKAEFWLPVDDYIGGAEHAVMHLLYARFWTKVMFDEGLISFEEPFKTLRNHGMILAPDGLKMSKSKGNTIEPSGLISQGYGADAVRIMELFIGPWDQSAAWSVEGMGGCFRFLQRVWTITHEYKDLKNEKNITNPQLTSSIHKTIAKVSSDLVNLSFNTAIATMMEYVNTLYKIKAEDIFESKEWAEALSTLAQLLAPFAPHIAEELWSELGNEGSVHTSDWPVHDEKYLVTDTVKIVIQVNGKVRATIVVPTDSDKQSAVAEAKKNPKVVSYLEGKIIKKTIFVKNKLVSIVV